MVVSLLMTVACLLPSCCVPSGAYPDFENLDDKTALEVAQLNEHPDVIDVLRGGAGASRHS